MKRPVKIILGIATAWPIVYLTLLITSVLGFSFYNALIPPARKPGIWLSALMALQALTLPWSLVMLVFYIANVYRNHRVDQPSKHLWALALFLGGMLTMPVYWYLYIWSEFPPDSYTDHHWPDKELKWSNRPKPTALQRVIQLFFPKVTVFLASTFDDLQVERVAVASELLWSDFDVIKMEYDDRKKNDDSYATTWIAKNLKQSDVVLVLFGHEAGSISPTLKPYTLMEMEEAISLRKRLLVYKLHKPFPDEQILEAHYQSLETMRLSSIPDYIPDKERLTYLCGPADRDTSRRKKNPSYRFRMEDVFALFKIKLGEGGIPVARDAYSAGEMLEGIKIEIMPLATSVRTSRIIAYILILWALSLPLIGSLLHQRY